MNDRQPTNLFVLPSKNKNNKYIELLIKSLRQENSGINFVDLPNDSLFGIFGFIKSGQYKNHKNIVHIQWPTILYGSRFFLKSIFLLKLNILTIWILKRFFDFKFAWTVHNFYAHDYPHYFIDALGQKFVHLISDVIIVQQETTLTEYKEKFPSKKIEYVPHGNYVGEYGPKIDRDQSLRQKLGFGSSDVVLVSLGAIAPYKLNERIIKTFVAAQKSRPDLKLLITGKGKPAYVEKLRVLTAGIPEIVIQNEFIPDSEIPKYLSIADYSVFYYDSSEMTSGGLILSLSYGVPAIIRKIPAAEIVGDKNGFVFSTDEEFLKILEDLKSPTKAIDSHVIIENIKNQSWSNSAKKLIKIYGQLG